MKFLPHLGIFLILNCCNSNISSAFAKDYESCIIIPSAGGEIHGEEHQCGDKVFNLFKNPGEVKCGTAMLSLPPWKNIRYFGRASRLSPGWWAWEGDVQIERLSYLTIISTSAKNWNSDHELQICATATTDE